MPAEFLTEAELHIGRSLSGHWQHARDTFREASALSRACSAHAAECNPQTAVSRAQHILLARVADDLSGLLVLGAVGYEMQAIALSASAYEVGHLAAFIGDSDARALKWLEWKKHEQMPWPVSSATSGALRNAGRFTEATSKRQYIFYQSACLAKHANPLLQRSAPVAESQFARAVNADPHLTPGATNRAFLGAYIAGVSALLAAEVYLKVFGSADSVLVTQHQALVPRWNLIAHAFETVRDTNGKRRGPVT